MYIVKITSSAEKDCFVSLVLDFLFLFYFVCIIDLLVSSFTASRPRAFLVVDDLL